MWYSPARAGLVEQREGREPAQPLVGFGRDLRCGWRGADPEVVHRLHERLRERRVEVHAESGAEGQDVVHGDRAFGCDGLPVDRPERVDEHAAVGELREQCVDGIVEAEQVLLHQDQRRDRGDRFGDRRDAELAVGFDRRRLAAREPSGHAPVDVVTACRQPGHATHGVAVDVAEDGLADPPDPGRVEGTVEGAHGT